MDSLAAVAVLVTLCVLGTGPLAVALTLSDLRTAGAVAGVAAIASGLWLAMTLPHAWLLWVMPVAAGAWSVWRWIALPPAQ